jgi:hypothetical protein
VDSGGRLRTLADVFAYAAAEGVTLRMDATEIRVRRPHRGRGGRKAFVSGKAKQNTIKTTVISDEHGSPLWCGAHRRGGSTMSPPCGSKESTRCCVTIRR